MTTNATDGNGVGAGGDAPNAPTVSGDAPMAPADTIVPTDTTDTGDTIVPTDTTDTSGPTDTDARDADTSGPADTSDTVGPTDTSEKIDMTDAAKLPETITPRRCRPTIAHPPRLRTRSFNGVDPKLNRSRIRRSRYRKNCGDNSRLANRVNVGGSVAPWVA